MFVSGMLHFYSIKSIKLEFVDLEIRLRDGAGFPFTTWLLPRHENACASSPLAVFFFYRSGHFVHEFGPAEPGC